MLILGQVGIGGAAKLADFGALGRAGGGAEAAARVVDTCAYSAPEVLRQVRACVRACVRNLEHVIASAKYHCICEISLHLKNIEISSHL